MQKTRKWIVLGLFFGSGATALIYEVVWSKYLALMFGSTIQAQTVVLAVFMGGLALGNRLFGKTSARIAEPLRGYAFMELGIGVYAFLFPLLFAWADGLFVKLGSGMLGNGLLLTGLKGAISVGLLIIPTVLMGGTLPLIASWLQRQSDDAGRYSARFYSVNSLGAVAGAGLAGFYLVATLGLVATIQFAALINAVIGGVAYVMNNREPAAKVVKPGTEISTGIGLGWASFMVAMTGAISMGLEVLAARSLSLIFGSSLQSFAVVLMAFILGIGLGSAAAASPRLQTATGWRCIVWVLIGASFWIGVLVFKIELWVEAYRWARSGLAASMTGYLFYQTLTAVLAMILLGVPAALIGSVLPLLIRLGAGRRGGLGEKVGQLLTWNTIGAVVGVLLTGFFLMPTLGLRGSFLLLAMGLGGMALWTSHQRREKPLMSFSGAALGFVLVAVLLGGEGWRHVFSSGVFRARETQVDPMAMELRKRHINILFYEDAADATVSVEQGDGQGTSDNIGLRINGKPDASSRDDLSTQLLLGHLPLLARPGSKDVFVLGLGSGITGGAVLAHPVDTLTIAENCKPVIRAARFFDPWNRKVLDDPRTNVRGEDARTVLKLDSRKYDVIISQPSNPWMAGVGSVFSREYYELTASRLKPGGIAVQWFHIYEMHDGIVSMVLRTFASVFPFVEIWDSGTGDIILMGSPHPWPDSPMHYERGFNRDLASEDLQSIGIGSVPVLLARQLASQHTAFAIPEAGPVQSDAFPVLEYEAPRAFYLGITSRVLARFDERTWQKDLASPVKRKALASLSPDELGSLFAGYGTMNREVRRYVEWRLKSTDTPGSAPPDVEAMPSIFRGHVTAAKPEIPEDVSPEIARLIEADHWLDNQSGRREEGIHAIETLLNRHGETATWSTSHYAARAAKACIAETDLKRATSLVELGLRYSPDDTDLRYLARVLDREQNKDWKLSLNR